VSGGVESVKTPPTYINKLLFCIRKRVSSKDGRATCGSSRWLRAWPVQAVAICVQCLARKIWRILLKFSRDQPTHFNPQVLVQGYKMGSKVWIWKNKLEWKQLETYQIDVTYFRCSKTFNIVWKNLTKLEATAGHLKRMKKKKWKIFTARFFTYCGVKHPGVPKGVKALNFQSCPCFADHCDPRFHLFSFLSHVQLRPLISSDIFKQYSRFLKICNKWNQFYKFQIVFNLISCFRFILLNPFCTPKPRLVTWSMLVGLLDFNKMRQIYMARHCT
jgi:hypothetical protein